MLSVNIRRDEDAMARKDGVRSANAHDHPPDNHLRVLPPVRCDHVEHGHPEVLGVDQTIGAAVGLMTASYFVDLSTTVGQEADILISLLSTCCFATRSERGRVRGSR